VLGLGSFNEHAKQGNVAVEFECVVSTNDKVKGHQKVEGLN